MTIYDYHPHLTHKISILFFNKIEFNLMLLILGFEDTTGFMTHLLLEDYFKDEVLGNFTSMTSGLIDVPHII